MPRKQTFQCPGCLKVFKDNYALTRHLSRNVPCTGRPTRVARRLQERLPRQKIRAQEIREHFDEVQRTQQQMEQEPLTENELTQLEDAFRNTGNDLRRAMSKYGPVDPAFNELVDLNTNMVSLMSEAERRGVQPRIDDVQELTKLFYEQILTEHPDANPDEAIERAFVSAQNVISEQLNAYQMGLDDPLFYGAQHADESVYHDRLLRYYELRTHYGMIAWQHGWALEVGAGTTAVTGFLLYQFGEPFTFLANWLQSKTPFVAWDAVNLPILGHTPLGGLLGWVSSVVSSSSNVMVEGLTGMCKHLSGIAFGGQILVSLSLGILAFLVAHLYLRLIHAKKVKVGVPLLVDVQLEN